MLPAAPVPHPVSRPAPLPCAPTRPQVLGAECHNRQMPMLPSALIDLASWVCPF